MPIRVTSADLDTARAHSAQVVAEIKADLGLQTPDVRPAAEMLTCPCHYGQEAAS